MGRTEESPRSHLLGARLTGSATPLDFIGSPIRSCPEIPALRGLACARGRFAVMSTASFAHPALGPSSRSQGHGPRDDSRAPKALAAALLLAILYAAFAHGAVSSPAEPRLQVALAAVAALAAGAWLWTGTLRLAAPRLATAGDRAARPRSRSGAGSHCCGASRLDQTWIELNRTLTYVLVLCLALALGASYARAIRVIAIGFWLVALAVSFTEWGRSCCRACTSPASSTSTRPVSSRACRSRSDTGMRSRCSSRWASRRRSRSPSINRAPDAPATGRRGLARADVPRDRIDVLAWRGARARARGGGRGRARAEPGCGH